MSDEFQKRLLAYLDAAEKGVREAGPAVGGELEHLVREWLAWEFYSNLALCLGLLAALAVNAVLLVRAARWSGRSERGDDYSEEEIATGALIVAIVAGVFLLVANLVVGLPAGFQAAKVAIAPRVVVVEKLAEMAKGVRK